MVTMTCPKCHGQRAFAVPNQDRTEWHEMYCPLCDGEGVIETEKWERIKRRRNEKTNCDGDRSDA